MMGFLLASTFDDFIISSISQIASGMGANAIKLGAIALLFVLILIQIKARLFNLQKI